MPTSEAQKRAIKNNLTLNCYGMSCHFSYSTDSDIIEMLKSVDNKQAYIKTLIRADILAKGGQTNG